MRKYQTLIIGAGKQGTGIGQEKSQNKIISFAKAFNIHEGFFIGGFIDKDIYKANNAAKIYNTHIFSSINNAFDVSKMEIYGEIDIAVVSTSDETHYELLKQLADHPLKLVICEKPICTNLQEAREIVELYKQKNIPILVNYTRRFLPYYQELKYKYESGEFGRLLNVQIVTNKGILHTTSHAIDFVQWFTTEDDKKNNTHVELRILDKYNLDYRVWNIQLFFEKHFWQEQRINDMPVWEYYDKSHWHVINNAYNFLEGKEPLKCTGEDGLRALEICFKVMER
jgi:predicted dehydrogenase